MESLLLVFSFLVRSEGRVQKTHVLKDAVFSLPISQSIFLFTFFTICFFLPFLMFFSSKKQKSIEIVGFICLSHLKKITKNVFSLCSLQKNFISGKKSFLSCRCLILLFVFAFSNFKKENCSLPFFKTSFLSYCVSPLIFLLFYF